MSALLVGALAIGNPFLPQRQAARSAAPFGPERSGAAPLAHREPRAIAPFAVRAVWQDPRTSPRRSPMWALSQQRLVLPRDVGMPLAQPDLPLAQPGLPLAQPASFVAPAVRVDGAQSPQ